LFVSDARAPRPYVADAGWGRHWTQPIAHAETGHGPQRGHAPEQSRYTAVTCVDATTGRSNQPHLAPSGGSFPRGSVGMKALRQIKSGRR